MPAASVAHRTPATGPTAGKPPAGASGETGRPLATRVLSRRCRLFRLGLVGLGRPVHVEALDLGAVMRLRDELIDDLARDLLLELGLLLLKARHRRAAVQDLDHVPAELALHRVLAHRAGLDLERRLRELRHHGVALEVAEIAGVLL